MDELAVVDFLPGGRYRELLDIEQLPATGIHGDIVKERATFKYVPPDSQDVSAAGRGRFDGSRPVTQRYNNAACQARWWIYGSTAQLALDNAEAFVAQVKGTDVGRYLRWRPVGAPYATFFELRGPGSWTPDYSSIRFEQNFSIAVDASWPVAPAPTHGRYDLTDDFAVDSVGLPIYSSLVLIDADLYWKIDETAGTNMDDSSPNNRDGTATNITLSQVALGPDTIRSGLFNGSSSKILSTFALSAVSKTFMGLARLDGTGERGLFGSSVGNAGLTWKPASSGWAWKPNTSVASQSYGTGVGAPVIGEVFHWALAWDNAALTGTLYINGVSVGTKTYASGLDISNFQLGTGTDGPAADWWSGLMDEISIHPGALSAARIKAMADAALLGQSVKEWTHDTANVNAIVSGGALVAFDTTEKRLYQSERGILMDDFQITIKLWTGGSSSVGWVGAGKRLDALNYIVGGLTSNTPSGTEVTNGATQNFNTGSAVTVGTNKYVWIRVRFEGTLMIREYFVAEPTPMGTPDAQDIKQMDAGNFAKFQGLGLPIVRYQLNDTTQFIEEVVIEPLTYRSVTSPYVLRTNAIPGDGELSALTELQLDHSGGSARPEWMLAGWWRKPAGHSPVFNGDFEDATFGITGWSALASGAGARVTTQAKFGLASMEITASAGSANSGMSMTVPFTFRRGVQYTVESWVRSSTSTAQVSHVLAGTATATATLSTTWQKMTSTYTPGGDNVDPVLSIRRNTSGAADVFQVDGIRVYEASSGDPARPSQIEGRGAISPVGILNGASMAVPLAAIVSDSNYRGNGKGTRQTTSGAHTLTGYWIVDPSLIDPDLFTDGELAVEYYARIELASTVVTPKALLSWFVFPPAVSSTTMYTAEFGTDGKLITKPSSGTVFRTIKLGTLTYQYHPQRPARAALQLTLSCLTASSGSFGLDQVYGVPVRSRTVSGPTGVAGDADYPFLTNVTTETLRVFRSDGSGLIGTPAQVGLGVGLSRGVELDQGADGELLVMLDSEVPDDPTSSTATTQKNHSATVHLGIEPRLLHARGS